MHTYDFDKVIHRLNTASVKWDQLEKLYGSKDLVSMWVADMDFASPQPVVEALERRAAHGIYGYTVRTEAYLDAVCGWMQRRHNWTVDREWLCHSPGVVPAIGFIINAFTEPNDKIVIQPPVYYPFTRLIERNGRQLVHNPLQFDGQTYTFDLDNLRQHAQDGAKMLILCNPHNPVGRVWTEEELKQLGEICVEYGMLVVSDEIHGDLVYSGHRHVPFASVSDALAQSSIVCTAPSKTFNLAGLQTSNLIIANPELRKTYTDFVERIGLTNGNTFGLLATEVAYTAGDEWLNQLLAYLEENLRFTKEYFSRNIPQIRVIEPEGTYLVWLDCRELGLNDEELAQFMRTEGGVALDDGHIFGPGGGGFERMNIACPRSILADGLQRMERALRKLTTA